MRKLAHLLAILALFFFTTNAFAIGNDESCQGDNTCNTDNSVTAEAAGGTGIAGAAAFAAGGDAFSGSQSQASATQGQQQGLVGIQGQLGILDNENQVTNGNEIQTSTKQGQGQGQDQTAVGQVGVDSHDEVNIDGDDVIYEAPDIPVNSAAPVFAGACSQGVSIQTSSFGGSVGSSNPVCDYVAVAGGFVAAGERTEALRVLGKAEKAADWRYLFSQIRSVLTLGLL